MADRSSQINVNLKQKIYWRDFDRNLSLNPVTDELVILLNGASVTNAVENLVMTNSGERFYHPEIGGNILATLFNLMDYLQDFQTDNLENEIQNMLSVQEPRVQNVSVSTQLFPQDNYIVVNIEFTVINIANQRFSLPIVVPIRGG